MKKDYGGLHVIVDDNARWTHDPIAQAEAACLGGARVIQLRAKLAPDRQILHWALRIRHLTFESGALFVLNDRFDIALLASADGVHLGQGDISPGQIPAEIRARLDIGRSTHNRKQAAHAVDEGACYIGFGPVFETDSKDSPYSARGLDQLREAVDATSPLPVIAIGGVDASMAKKIHSTGAAGLAVISAVAANRHPATATTELTQAFALASEAET